jgi:hypothetical protein
MSMCGSRGHVTIISLSVQRSAIQHVDNACTVYLGGLAGDSRMNLVENC